jgi:antirestriction protein ArdC
MAEKDRNKKMKEIMERLEQGVKEIFTSEMYMEYLKTMSQFHNYSFNNTLLIHLQKPDASLVAGYQAWQKKFKRQVRRGEKGIQIIAPAPIREKEEVEKIDPATMEPVLKPDGTPETEEVVYTIPRFRITTVFDVSQTEGEPLPELETPELTGSVENYEIFMRAIQDISPVPFRFDEIESGAKGYYSSTEKENVIQEGMSEMQTVKTSIHETTHAKLHDRDLMEELGEKKDQMTREVEAESIAYTVCQHFGLDTSDYSFPYIAGWSSNKDMKELRASMDTIRRTAGEMIDQIEERIREIQRETQRHQENALFEETQDRYGIYQIREDGAGTAYRFMGMAYLQEKNLAVDGADYQFVYGDELKEGDTLETLYEKFNIAHPEDYTGHSLSVSDVVVLKKDGELTAHYVDSFGYQELADFVTQRRKTQEIQTVKQEYPPLYLSDLSYAVEHRNADAYLDSRKLNLDCKKAIEAAIDGHFDGYHLAHDAAADVVEAYGSERVSFVLACTVQHLKTDGRFSKETKEWADSFIIPENISRGMDLNADYVVTSHPAVLDGFIDLTRQTIGAREQLIEKETTQVTAETKGFRAEGYFGTWHTAEAKEIAGETFYRMEHDEYGDTVAGIILDADGKLIAEDLEHGFDAGAMEAVTEYLYEKVPEPFIKQFYVVNDAYGDNADREYQYFATLKEALETYHVLPNHLDKQLGMESREPVTSRMPLICCKNGIEEVEDIEKVSLSGKWMNPEVTDAVNRAVFYLDNRDLEAAYTLPGMEQYFFIQSTDGGYDYTFYDADYREIDGGIYENEDVSEQEAIEDILSGEAGGKPVDYKVMELEGFFDEVEKRQEIATMQKETSICFYAAECMEFPVMGEYYDNLTLEEAFQKYKEIPSERINGIKGIGFRLEDGSMYDGDYELMRAGVISKDAIELVPHYKESPLVQKAMADLEEMLIKENQKENEVQPKYESGREEQDKPMQNVQKQEAEKPTGVRQSVLAALRERQAKQKAQEQKEEQKAEKKTQGHRKGEPEI